MGLEFVEEPTDEQAGEIDRGLLEYSADFASNRAPVPVRAVFLESGRVVAGIDGTGYWRIVHVRRLWVHPDHRSRGLGRRLMLWAEERGRELGCASVVVDTMSFQAPGFYVKLGYRQFGVTEGYEGRREPALLREGPVVSREERAGFKPAPTEWGARPVAEVHGGLLRQPSPSPQPSPVEGEGAETHRALELSDYLLVEVGPVPLGAPAGA